MTRADVEAVRAWRRQEQASGRSHSGSKGGEWARTACCRASGIFNWAIAEEYLEATPFKTGSGHNCEAGCPRRRQPDAPALNLL